jgi:hypothetical protein
METLAFFANLGSLVGLVATRWTAWQAYQSKKYYQLVGRVPDGIRMLEEGTSRLYTADDEQEQRLALGQVRVGLESIARNIGKNDSEDSDALAGQIRQIEQSGSYSDSEADDVYIEAQTLASQAETVVSDSKFLRAS